MYKEKECDCCGKITKNRRFCSISCAAKVTNKETPKRKVTRTCSKCDKPVKSHRHALCEEHFLAHKSRFKQELTVGEYRTRGSVKGKHPSWINAHVRLFARSWLKHLAKSPCAKCGYSLHVELAHIRPVSNFPDDAKLGDINSHRNVIQLCPNCHWEFDNLPREGEFDKLLTDLEKQVDLD